MGSDGGQWDVALLHELFDADSTAAILRLPTPNPLLADQWVWTRESTGKFSVISFWLAVQGAQAPAVMPLDKKSWSILWKAKLQDRLKLLLWKVAVGALKSRGALGRILQRENEEQFQCPLCRSAPEDTLHLLVNCNVATKIWRESPWAIRMDCIPFASAAELYFECGVFAEPGAKKCEGLHPQCSVGY